MKIYKSCADIPTIQPTTISLGALLPGTVFKYGDWVYMRTNNGGVNLTSGQYYDAVGFNNSTAGTPIVALPDAKLITGEKG